MTASRQSRWQTWWFAVLAMMILPGIVSVLYLKTAPHKPIDSIAVLPFAFPTGDNEAASLSNAITNQLTGGLSQLQNVTVISAAVAARYAQMQTDARPDAKTAGHALGARAVVMGQIERHDENLLVSAELFDSGDNSLIWDQRYSIKASEIATRQQELVNEIQKSIRFH